MYRVMIVDDEVDVREEILRRINWAALGFEVVAIAENGQDALEKAESCPLDLVLTDIKMPYMDGLTLSAHMHRLYPAVRLIMLSGFDRFDFAKEAIRLNVVEYILKPVDFRELTGVLTALKAALDNDFKKRRDTSLLELSYKKSYPLLRDHFIQQLLSGMVPARELEYQLDHFKLPIRKGKHKVVVVFELDRTAQTAAIDKKLLPVSLKQLIDDRLEGSCQVVSLISFSEVISITAWEDNPIGNLVNLANMICADCQRLFKVGLTAGIGRSYVELSSIQESYLQARAAAEYKLLLGSGKAYYIRDMELTEGDPLVFDGRSEQRLITAIKFGDKEKVRSLIESILSGLTGAEITAWRYQAYIMGILCAVSQIANRYGLNETEVLGENDAWFFILSKDFTLEKLREWLLNTCVRISGTITEKRISTSRSLVEQAKRFIEENYASAQLSVDMICEHLHISQSHFSNIFKQETGQSFVQYLTDVRMERALRLLSETDEKTYMIAQKVGYDEPNYFSYVFKRKFGTAPSQYRR